MAQWPKNLEPQGRMTERPNYLKTELSIKTELSKDQFSHSAISNSAFQFFDLMDLSIIQPIIHSAYN